MVINAVYGLKSTAMTMNERFTALEGFTPTTSVSRSRAISVSSSRAISVSSSTDADRNRLRRVEMMVEELQQELSRQYLKQQLGFRSGGMDAQDGRYYSGSEGNLRSRSFYSNRFNPWWQSTETFNRSRSACILPQLRPRYWRGGSGNRGIRGRSRSRGMQNPRGYMRQQRDRRGRPEGQAGRIFGPSGRGRGRCRGGMRRQKPVPSREELDAQLDEYMSSSKSALDTELDVCMSSSKSALDTELDVCMSSSKSALDIELDVYMSSSKSALDTELDVYMKSVEE